MSMNMSPRQCSVLEGCLELIRQFFHASGEGLRLSYLDRSPELLSLLSALSLYTQTTDSLIKTFIDTQTAQGELRSSKSSGVWWWCVVVMVLVVVLVVCGSSVGDSGGDGGGGGIGGSGDGDGSGGVCSVVVVVVVVVVRSEEHTSELQSR